ncbi:MAG: ABC transporter ATP-binding protein [Trueperaceae bacterium]|nr:ABC transporter ATP-binding protein [Trueperaceae bacterium]
MSADAPEAVLHVRDLHKAYEVGGGTFEALKGVSFDVHPGEMVALMGPSGSGKSTLMNILGLLDRPTEGRYRLGGRDVADLTENERAEARNERVGFVFQAFHLLPRVSLLENVAMPMVYAGVPAGVRRDRARILLERVGLGDKTDAHPNRISGGQKQRAAVARALAMDPDLLLADEPTGNLDSQTGHEIMALFHRLNAEGSTVMVVTHERDIAAQTGRTLHLLDGELGDDERHDPVLPDPVRARLDGAAPARGEGVAA